MRYASCIANLVSAVAAEDVARGAEAFGAVDILVNNAGVARTAPAEDPTEADWDAVLDTNLKGAFFVAQAIGRGMLERGAGMITGEIVAIDGGYTAQSSREGWGWSQRARIGAS